ncbi:Hsp70 nucleotide exchange factor FES1 [Termitomyces sp. J132]|nr:hypothetical protein H2248_001321 [Termitomyces sp. 'cryptogamus']KNZ76382.1 Hsp70 nucleotide exchange factor FES1 [Termitomyces sp. J132]
MQSLLRWSIENSTDLNPNGPPPEPRKDIDPGIIDMILGRPDAELMKEDMSLATDPSKTEDERVAALDHMEMLIEQIDNANDLAKLKLWEPLHALLTASTSTPEIKMQALWVIGTAIQNNPSAQDAYLALDPLSTLISFLTPSPSSTLQTRSKAIYTLSGLLKHNSPAVQQLNNPSINGWKYLRDALSDPEITVRRKTIFLLSTLLLPTTSASSAISSAPIHEPLHDNSHAAHISNPERASTSTLTASALQTHGILNALVQALTSPLPYGEDGDVVEPDVTFEETGIRLFHTYLVLCGQQLSKEDAETLKFWMKAEQEKDGGEKKLADRWALYLADLKELVAKLG